MNFCQRVDTMKLLLTILAAFILCGCGQSGPLYIPGDPSRIESPPPAENSAEEDADERSRDGEDNN
jgi:predicted small lipoprotein YifL